MAARAISESTGIRATEKKCHKMDCSRKNKEIWIEAKKMQICARNERCVQDDEFEYIEGIGVF